MIVDAQVHVWTAETPERPWFSGPPHLPEPFGYEDLLREMKAAGVDRAVLIPPGWEGDRVDFALEGAQRHPDRFGVMGRIAIQKPAVAAALLPGWKAQRGMLGIRVSFQKAHNERFLADGTADWFWPAAEKHGIPVMVFAPGKDAAIRAVAENHPKLRIVVDHMGLAREQDAAAGAAIERLCALADCPNVHVKVSSVPLYSTEPYPYRNLHGALRRLIGAFGPQRSFWGTDLTRIWTRGAYRQFVTLFTEELTFLSADDLEWVMGRGVARCLEWPLPVTAR
jgi:predicted TIM-barrel fold metal-dependent hydrolase